MIRVNAPNTMDMIVEMCSRPAVTAINSTNPVPQDPNPVAVSTGEPLLAHDFASGFHLPSGTRRRTSSKKLSSTSM
jgi:hypothetical protein